MRSRDTRRMLRAAIFAALALHSGTSLAAEIGGVVADAQDRPVAGAAVLLRTTQGVTAASAVTDDSGAFRLDHEGRGSYLLEVRAAQFQSHRRIITLGDEAPGRQRILLSVAGPATEISVTSSPGTAAAALDSSQLAVGLDARQARQSGFPTLGNALAGLSGVHLQQSTAGQASPFLRGLTGFHVLYMVDGVRFNNSTFRYGPNQYLAYIDPAQADYTEVTLGPASSEYGSDALGGVVHVLAPPVSFAPVSQRQARGRLTLFGATADMSGGSSAEVALGGERLSILAGGAWRRHNDIRAGGGIDSHNVLRRYLGLESGRIRELIGSRLQDSAFSQDAQHFRLAFRFSRDQQLAAWYQRSEQHGVHGYKDLWGGQGRLRSQFAPQALQFFYVRHIKDRWGFLDAVSSTFALNAQRDGYIGQGLRGTDPVRSEMTSAEAFQYSLQARAHRGSGLVVVSGAEFINERVRSDRYPFPPGARYRTLAIYGQAVRQGWRGFKFHAGTRFTTVRFIDRSFSNVSFNGAATSRLTDGMSLHFRVARGFRAPNLNDLGATGLQDLGFEIPAEQLASAGALIGASSGEETPSTGRAMKRLGSETLLNYEIGWGLECRRGSLRAQVFDAELYDAIARRTALFPADRVPSELAGFGVAAIEPSAEQKVQGVLPVATVYDPRAVKAFINVGRQRYWGGELHARIQISSLVALRGAYSYLAGRDLEAQAPVRRLPPQQGSASLRWSGNARFWAELSLDAAGPQRKLSGGDLSDERIGAERSRSDIAAFFHSARLRPWVRDGVFLPTGETLAAIQDRVLSRSIAPHDRTRIPLFSSTPGFAAIHLQAGVPLREKARLVLALRNILDRNYRHHGSGVDAAGRSLHLLLEFEF